MSDNIYAPTDDDYTLVVKKLFNAKILCDGLLKGTLADLPLLQHVVDGLSAQDTYKLQCLGMAFGQVFVNENQHKGYDWWMYEDEQGRDPCVRYKHTSLIIFPQTMISKRVEDGEFIDVQDLYTGIVNLLEQNVRQHFSN